MALGNASRFSETAAPVVFAPVGVRRHELLDQMSLRPVYFNAVPACLDAMNGTGDVDLDGLTDLKIGKRVRNAT